MRERLTVTPAQFRLVAYVTLGALTLIVLTGAAVRLTDSGLGCPDWPKCGGNPLPPLSTHALIEFGNRAISGLVGVLTMVAASCVHPAPVSPRPRLLACCCRSVLAQAVLGGFTVREHLAPGFVMAHFGLRCCADRRRGAGLAQRASARLAAPRHRPGVGLVHARAAAPGSADDLRRHRGHRRRSPRGRSSGQRIHRLHFEGADTLMWVIHRHATIAALFGVARAIVVAVPAPRRGDGCSSR